MTKAEEALKTGGDIEGAALALSAYRNSEAQGLLKRLNEEMIKREVSNQISAIQAELAKFTGLDVVIAEYAYNRAFQTLLELRTRVVSVGLTDDKLQQQLDALDSQLQRKVPELMKAKQKKYSGEVREYQQWALGQIKMVRQYDYVLKAEKELITSIFDRNNPLSAESEKASHRASSIIRDELIQLLAPINQGLLEEAVNQLFRKVYQSRFDKFHEDDQFEVTKQFAMAEKRPLER